MANVGRNIKRFRKENSITQDVLADQVGVTRQAVSNWETGKTQPDIDTLERLSSALSVSIEDLIYGRRNTRDDGGASKRRTLAIVLTSLGTFLTAVGLILIFAFYWGELAERIKLALALLPLAAGSAAGLFVIFKKRDNIFFREAAAVLWCAGVFATNALVDSVFPLGAVFDLPFLNILEHESELRFLTDMMLVTPIMFLLNSASVYTVLTVLMSVITFEYGSDSVPAVIFIVIMFAVFIFFAVRSPLPDGLKKYVAAFAVLAVPVNAAALVFSNLDEGAGFTFLFTVFICLFYADKTKKTGIPLRWPGIIGFGLLLAIVDPDWIWFDFRSGALPAVILEFAVCAALIAAAFFYGRESLKKVPEKKLVAIAMPVLGALSVILALADYVIDSTELVSVLGGLISLAFGIVLIVTGVKKASLLLANLGMINVLGIIIKLLYVLVDTSVLAVGFILFGAGVIVLVTNLIMLKKFGRLKKDNVIQKGDEDDA